MTSLMMDGMMPGMMWAMGAMGLIWLLVVLILSVAAIIKYLRSGR